MANDVAVMNRAMAGDIADNIKELTGIDLRMVKDPSTLLVIHDLKELAKKKKMNPAIIKMLDDDEKRERIYQYVEWVNDELHEDVSKLGIASGNVEIKEGMDEGIV